MAEEFSQIRFIPCLCWRILRPLGEWPQRSSSLGQSRRSSAGIVKHLRHAYPPPTEASEIFTPGPMVEEMEIFFM